MQVSSSFSVCLVFRHCVAPYVHPGWQIVLPHSLSLLIICRDRATRKSSTLSLTSLTHSLTHFSHFLSLLECSFAITHDPGKMYISDAQQPDYDATRCDSDKCIVTKYSEKGQRYSITSIYLKKLLENLEAIVAEDPG